jgi:site-specific DNA-methyltransferase (adenine-specific)
LNIAASRIPTGEDTGRPQGTMPHPMDWGNKSNGNGATYTTEGNPAGRWPANLIHDGSPEVLAGFPQNAGGRWGKVSERPVNSIFGNNKASQRGNDFIGDTGSAARFFYCAKASKADRDEGLEGFEEKAHGAYANGKGMPGRTMINGEWVQTGTWDEPNRKPARNNHPTVKNTTLMRYLCRLITPPGGVILDPFTGSGSTGKAAVLEGFRFVGIEQDADYADIARARIEKAAAQERQLVLDIDGVME